MEADDEPIISRSRLDRPPSNATVVVSRLPARSNRRNGPGDSRPGSGSAVGPDPKHLETRQPSQTSATRSRTSVLLRGRAELQQLPEHDLAHVETNLNGVTITVPSGQPSKAEKTGASGNIFTRRVASRRQEVRTVPGIPTSRAL